MHVIPYSVAMASALQEHPQPGGDGDSAIVSMLLQDLDIWVGSPVLPLTLPTVVATPTAPLTTAGVLFPPNIANRINYGASGAGQWAAMLDGVYIDLANTVMTDADIDEVNRGYGLSFTRAGFVWGRHARDGIIWAGYGTSVTTTGATPTRSYAAVPSRMTLPPNLGGLLPLYGPIDGANFTIAALEAIAATVANASCYMHGAWRKVPAAADPFVDVYDPGCGVRRYGRLSIPAIIGNIGDASQQQAAQAHFQGAINARLVRRGLVGGPRQLGDIG